MMVILIFIRQTLELISGSYETEKSFFIINNYEVDGTFAYKENPHMEGSHEASSGDIDNDGDLDIYSYGRLGISQPSSPFYKNFLRTRCLNFQMWLDIMHQMKIFMVLEIYVSSND